MRKKVHRTEFSFRVNEIPFKYYPESGGWQFDLDHTANPQQIKLQKILDLNRSTINASAADRLYSVTIFLTTECNLSCRYCWNSFCAKTSMSLATAAKTMQYLRSHIEKNAIKKLQVCFYGGEPLLKPDLLGYFLDELLILEREKKIKLVVVVYSNGTIMNKKILRKISQFKEYDYQLSIDGNKAEHDRERNNSWDKIMANLGLLEEFNIRKSAHPMISYPYRFVAACNNLAALGFTYIWLQAFTYPVYRKAAQSPLDYKLWAEQYLKFCQFYLTKLGDKNFPLIMPISNVLQKFAALNHKEHLPCGGGGMGYIAISPAGIIYNCVIAAGLGKFPIGDVSKGIDNEKVVKFIKFVAKRSIPEHKCLSCPINLYCKATCLGDCFQKERIPEDFCKMMLEKFKIEIYFVYQLFKNHPQIAATLL